MMDIWYGLQDPEQYIYHYTKAETLTKYILASKHYRFSKFERLNDPREYKDWSFAFSSYADDIGASFDAIQAAYNHQLKRVWRLGCFTLDDDQAAIRHPDFDPIRALWHRGHSRPRMWAQYAEEYGGACLVFDRLQFNHAVKVAAGPAIAHHGKVVYEIDPFAGRPLAADNPHMINSNRVRAVGAARAAVEHVQRHYELLYFRKAPDWAAEKELRWAVSHTAADEFLVALENCLVGILLGDRFPNDLRSAVGEYALANNTDVAILDWRNNGVPQPLPTHPRLLIGSGV